MITKHAESVKILYRKLGQVFIFEWVFLPVREVLGMHLDPQLPLLQYL